MYMYNLFCSCTSHFLFGGTSVKNGERKKRARNAKREELFTTERVCYCVVALVVGLFFILLSDLVFLLSHLLRRDNRPYYVVLPSASFNIDF